MLSNILFHKSCNFYNSVIIAKNLNKHNSSIFFQCCINYFYGMGQGKFYLIVLSNFVSFFIEMTFISCAINDGSIDIKNKDTFKANSIDIEYYDVNTSDY